MGTPDDHGLSLAESLLAQLREDIKRFSAREAFKADAAIGRGPRYLRRVSAANLRLHEAFAAIRFLGFAPLEYFERLAQDKALIPMGIPGFLGRVGPPDSSCPFSELDTFESWLRNVELREPAPYYFFDVEAQLRLAGFGPNHLDVLAQANSLLSIFGRNRPGLVGSQTANSLLRSLVLISEALLEENHIATACRTTDLGFLLEERIGDLKRRGALFRIAARLCRQLGHPQDAIWCRQEAMLLGLLAADLGAVESDRQFFKHHLKAGEPKSVAARNDWPSAGKRDAVGAMRALVSERAAAECSAAELDRVLGARNAFSGALNRNEPVTVASWGRLLETLGLTPTQAVRRACLAPLPLGAGRFFHGLKETGPHRERFPFQKKLLKWVTAVSISEAGRRPSFPDIPTETAPEQAFDEAIQALETVATEAPDALPEQIARLVCRELIRVSYHLRTLGLRNDAADFLDAAFSLAGHWDSDALLGLAQRNGGYLAIELGYLQTGFDLAIRAAQLEVALGSYAGVQKSLYVAGTAARVAQDYKTAIQLFTACWALPPSAQALEPKVISYALADSNLRSAQLEGAQAWLRRVGSIETWPDRWKSRWLCLKAEIRSRLGEEHGPFALLDEAERLLQPEGDAISKALVSLQRCRHFVVHGLTREARAESRKLLTAANELRNNPRGRRALLEVCRIISRHEESLETIEFAKVERCLRWPNGNLSRWAINKQRTSA